jgi:hypothetical protein
MNAFYSSLSSAMENMAEASKDTAQFKGELSKLTNNLTSLNKGIRQHADCHERSVILIFQSIKHKLNRVYGWS